VLWVAPGPLDRRQPSRTTRGMLRRGAIQSFSRVAENSIHPTADTDDQPMAIAGTLLWCLLAMRSGRLAYADAEQGHAPMVDCQQYNVAVSFSEPPVDPLR